MTIPSSSGSLPFVNNVSDLSAEPSGAQGNPSPSSPESPGTSNPPVTGHALYAQKDATLHQIKQRLTRSTEQGLSKALPKLDELPAEIIVKIQKRGPERGRYLTALPLTSKTLYNKTDLKITLQKVAHAVRNEGNLRRKLIERVENGFTGDPSHLRFNGLLDHLDSVPEDLEARLLDVDQFFDGLQELENQSLVPNSEDELDAAFVRLPIPDRMEEFNSILDTAKDALISQMDYLDVVKKSAANLHKLAYGTSRASEKWVKAGFERLYDIWENTEAKNDFQGNVEEVTRAKWKIACSLVSKINEAWASTSVADEDSVYAERLIKLLDFININSSVSEAEVARQDAVELRGALSQSLGEALEMVATGGGQLDRFLDEHSEAMADRLRDCKEEQDRGRAATIWSAWKSLYSGFSVAGAKYPKRESKRGLDSLYSPSSITRQEKIDIIQRELDQLQDRSVAQDVAGTMSKLLQLLDEEKETYAAASELVGKFFGALRNDEERMEFIQRMADFRHGYTGFVTVEEFNIASTVVGAIEEPDDYQEATQLLEGMMKRIFDPIDRRWANAKLPIPMEEKIIDSKESARSFVFNMSRPAMWEDRKAKIFEKQAMAFWDIQAI